MRFAIFAALAANLFNLRTARAAPKRHLYFHRSTVTVGVIVPSVAT